MPVKWSRSLSDGLLGQGRASIRSGRFQAVIEAPAASQAAAPS
nr:MAG TPA: hypothetical protein [Caudoviricetes sp.]